MKLLEKITNLFMDEVDDDDEVELEEEPKEEYKEPDHKVLPKIMRDTIEREEKKEDKHEELPPVNLRTASKEIKKDEPVVPVSQERVKKFNFPIDFDDEVTKAEKREEIPQRKINNVESITRKNNVNHNVNVLSAEKETTKKIVELYPKKESNIKPKFKASPVISPVYGILDKNYKKEEVREKNDENLAMKRPSKKVDFETVRKKAFGNLADEIKDNLLCENCELYKEVKKISKLGEDDLLYDMTVEPDHEVTIENAYDNYEEFGVAYEPVKEKKKDKDIIEDEKVKLIDIINDNSNNIEEAMAETEVKINKNDINLDSIVHNNNEDIEKDVALESEQKEETEVEIPSREKNKKESKVDDDFFELIDSMYKERIDE